MLGLGCSLQKLCERGALCPPTGVSQAEAPLLPGALQLIPVPACSHAVSVCQVLQLLQGRKVLLLSFGPFLELFWCFISTRCLVFITKVSLPEAD